MSRLEASTPQRSHARSNRQRILAVAQQELIRNPDASMDDIARAAGVVRRTVYGHFPSREALLRGLADVAAQDVMEAVDQSRFATDRPEHALAAFVLATWPVGDRWRLLITLAERDLASTGIRELLRPAREWSTAILNDGQQKRVFAQHLPAPVLAHVVESVTLGLLQTVNDGTWAEGRHDAQAAVAALVAVGVSPARAAEVTQTLIAHS